jgi:hypothetical protein
LALLVVKDIEGKVKVETIKKHGMVMCFVLKDLYGKIMEKERVMLLDTGNVLSIS